MSVSMYGVVVSRVRSLVVEDRYARELRLFITGEPSSEPASEAGRGAGMYDERRGGSGRGLVSGMGSGEGWYADRRGGLGRGLWERGTGEA